MSMKSVRTIFYLITPSKLNDQQIENISDYIITTSELLLALQVFEVFFGWYKGKKRAGFNHIYSSLAAGIISRLPKFFIQSIELSIYTWVYERYHLFPNLQWNSSLMYWISFISVDFCYYWLHRMGHEINLFWATHQTHHSSEDYNFSVGLRQGFFQSYFSWIFYFPLSLIIPPHIFLIHIQMNLIYQFWLHTEIIPKLGLFEWIFNTPSHHRVHHGRNSYCIDRNYGGILIIWDRLFGTYTDERENEEIAYGLVHSFPSFNPFQIQICHFVYMYKEVFNMKGWKNKLSLIFKGPSWRPGSPRLGNGQYPAIKYPIDCYNPEMNFILSVYIFIQFLYVFIQYNQLLRYSKNYSAVSLIVYSLLLLFSLITFGAIFDGESYGVTLERIRLILTLCLSRLSIMREIFDVESHYIGQLLIIFSFLFISFVNLS